MESAIEENAERDLTGYYQQLVYGEAISGGMLRCRETSRSPELRDPGKWLLGILAGGAAAWCMSVVWLMRPRVVREEIVVGSPLVAWMMSSACGRILSRPTVSVLASHLAMITACRAGYTLSMRLSPLGRFMVSWQTLASWMFEESRPTVCYVGPRFSNRPQVPLAVDPPTSPPPGLSHLGPGQGDGEPERSRPDGGGEDARQTVALMLQALAGVAGTAPNGAGEVATDGGAGMLHVLDDAPEMDAEARAVESSLEPERPEQPEEVPVEAKQTIEGKREEEKQQVVEPPHEAELDGPIDAETLDQPDDGAVDFLSQLANEDGIVVKKHGMRALSMKAFNPDVTKQKDRAAPMLMVPPRGFRVEHWASCSQNIEAALFKRAVQPALPYTLADTERRQLRRQVHKLCEAKGPFSEARIAEWASTMLTAEDLCPKSWTYDKWRREYRRGVEDTSLRVSPGVAIKDEILEWLGKNKPRFLIADKEPGQVAARFVIKCFDALWFQWRAGHHLKYQAKPVAMDEVVKNFGRDLGYPTAVCEGDGSAWDSCCNSGVRDDTENIVLYHILTCLLKHALFMEHLGNAHQTVCGADKLGLKGPVQLKSDVGKKWVINAIRRSGHAGTSGLNGFLNAVLWSFTLTPEVCQHLQAQPTHHVMSRFTAVGGERIKVSGTNSYEGDDSLLLLPKALELHAATIESAWRSYGFHMKIFWRTEGMSTYTGYDFLVRNGRLTGAKVPSIRRNVLGCTFSISPKARMGWQSGKLHEVYSVGADTMLARATAFEADCAPLAHVYSLLAEHFAAKVHNYAPSDLNREHKRCEATLAGTVKRIRGSATPPTDDQIALWRLSMAGLPGDVPQLQALTGVDPESEHFLHAVA